MKKLLCIFKGHKWIFQEGRTQKRNIERTLADLHNLEWQGFRDEEELFKCHRCGAVKLVAC